MKKHDQKDSEEITLARLLNHVDDQRRELNYHRSIVEAAEKGYDDLSDSFSFGEEPLSDSDFINQLATWSRRLSLGMASVADVSNNIAHTFHTICDMTTPKPAGEETN